ncbi:MAG: peptidase M16 [Phycisphaeraceae bacterium]|nr:peptidase M16 [Phycisphaeraceae bacterium]
MALRFHKETLPNGLTVVAEENTGAHTAAVGFFVRTGARDEERPVMGVSHFLEHMMFKGTAQRTADEVNREFDAMGASNNAYTSEENTVYWARVLPEKLPLAVDLIGDMLRPALRDEDFDIEKNVILEEIGMYEDRPQWRLHDSLCEVHFGDHPMSYRILGTTDSIKALCVDQMRDYFSERYSPDNVTVAAAGKLDFGRLVEDVKQRCAAWAPTGTERRYDPPSLESRDHALQDPKLSRHYVAMICPGPTAQDPRRYAAAVLTDVLGAADGSRLYWALIDPGLADEADISINTQDRTGCYLAYASCDPGRAQQVEQILLETLDGYAQRIDAGEIERAKNKIATDDTLAGESPGGRMRAIGLQWTYLGRYVSLAEEIEQLMAVTVDDVRDLMTAYPFQPRTVARLGP